jgi:hypothetical protein
VASGFFIRFPMAYLIYLRRLDDYDNQLPISTDEWAACATAIEAIRITDEGEYYEVQHYHEQQTEWSSLLWLDDDGNGFIKSVMLFDDAEQSGYLKLLEVAIFLDAYLEGEAGELYYIPGWQRVFRNNTDEIGAVSPEELQAYKAAYGTDIQDLSERLVALRKKMATVVPEVASPLTMPKPMLSWWQRYGWLLLPGASLLFYLVAHWFGRTHLK